MFDFDALGWSPFFQEQWESYDPDQWTAGRVALIQRSNCLVWTDQDERDIPTKYFATPKDLAVGDWVRLPHDKQVKIPRFERRNLLSRQASDGRGNIQLIAANVDTLLIVMACNQDFNLCHLERFLILALENEARPVLALTKADLTENAEDFRTAAASLWLDLEIHCMDARDNEQIAPLLSLCGPGQTVALIGSSGMGKSTLINGLAEADQLTWEVSEFNNKGQHTTTERSLHISHAGGILMDTPGMREPQLVLSPRGMEAVFSDIMTLEVQCRFRDCRHQTEQDCAVQAALANGTLDRDRWQRYQQLSLEQTQYAQLLAKREQRELGRRRPRRRK